MSKQLHPLFEEIMQDAIRNALPLQMERERNKVVSPREYHPETYMEIHENREELQYRNDGYPRGWR